MTRFGPLDIIFVPDGAPGGFSDLATAAVMLDLAEQRVLAITPATWLTLKRASGRAKDLAHLDSYDAAIEDERRLGR